MRFSLALICWVGLLAQEPPPAPDPRADTLTKLLEPKADTKTCVQAAVLHTKDKDLPLEGMLGGFATTYAFITILIYSDFPELAAPARTIDTQPTILVRSPGSPRGKLFLVKVEVNKKKGNRSLKMGNSGFGSMSSIQTPDQDWVIPVTTKEVQPEVWEFTPQKPLKPGEYGLFASLAAGVTPGGIGGQLFDFGVDAP
jgi:hypothetical protein